MVFAEAPPVATLLRELASPSLFAPQRLVVVRDAAPYLDSCPKPKRPANKPRSEQAGEAEDEERDGEITEAAEEQPEKAPSEEVLALAEALATFSFSGVSLLLTAVCAAKPEGCVVQVVEGRGEVKVIELPPPPKPWEKLSLSNEQRQALEKVILRAAPELAGQEAVCTALCNAYGFEPRRLAQAARQLVQSGEVSVAAVHAQAGLGERALTELEELLLESDPARAAHWLAALLSGGELAGWRGEAVAPKSFGRALGHALTRVLRQVLAVRGHACRAGLAAELDPRRCAAKGWYNDTFRKHLLSKLQAEIAAHPASPVDGKPRKPLTPWVLHRLFKLAARYPETALLRCLVQLEEHSVEVAKGAEAVAIVSVALHELLAAAVGPKARTARAG